MNVSIKAFSTRLKIIFEEKGWEGKMAAYMLGVSPGTISHYLSGRNLPDAGLLFHIADVLEVSVDWLAGRTDDREVQKFHAPPDPSNIE